ncbi:ExbD/TolR family protein [Deferrisoma camini]|uniref:ExbD/TolR family protein n=1 Tax=Deferrisoma camini TaxID=1035120 RepID=UPI00046D465C|nr:ExbD/TolR family protein [Deferrisoma camini]
MNAPGPAGGRTARTHLAEINVTPLVDVMLVLLIIFMVAAPMIQQGVDVNLPEVVATELPAQTDLMVISVDRAGRVFLGNTPVPMEALAEKLGAIYRRKGTKEAFLRADRDVPYGVVVRVMAEAKRAGIERLGMITEPPEEP